MPSSPLVGYSSPYPGGWRNKPDTSTPIDAAALDVFDQAVQDTVAAVNVRLPLWQPSTSYVTGQAVVSPAGQVVKAISSHISASTYNGALWVAALDSVYASLLTAVPVLADPTGVTDSTAAFAAQSAAMGAPAGTLICRLGIGTYKVNATGYSRVVIEGVSSELSTLIPASGTSPILDFGGTGDLSDQSAYIDKVRITTGGVDRAYAYPLIRARLTRNMKFGDDVWFDVAGFTALCVRFSGVYQCRWRNVRFRTGKWGVPLEWDNTLGLPGTVIASGTVATTFGSKTATVTVTSGSLATTDQIVAAGIIPAQTIMRTITGTGPFTVTLANRATATASGVAFQTFHTPQCDTSEFDMQVDGTISAIFRDAINESHGLNFLGKCVQTTYYATAPAENTTLSSAAAPGDTTIAVVSATGVVAGDVLVLDPGWDACEAVRVQSVSSNTITLHASTPIRFDHLSAAEVFRGGVPFSFGDGFNNLHWHQPHFEGQQICVAAGNCHNLVLESPYKYAGRLVHIIGNVSNLTVRNPLMAGTVNLNELVRRASNATGSSDGIWICEDPHVPPGASITPVIPGGYFPHNTRTWMLRATQSNQIAEYWNANSGQNGAYHRRVYVNGVEKANLTYGGGGAVRGRSAQAASYTILSPDPEYIGVTDTSAARTITLPAASSVVPGKTFIIVDESNAAAANNITVTRSGTDTIVGGTTTTTAVISTNGGNRKVYSDGNARWIVI